MSGSGNTSYAFIYAFKNRLQDGGNHFGCLMPLLLVLIAVNLTGCGSGSGSDTDFERMLRYVPVSVTDHPVWYADWAKGKEINDWEDIHTLDEFNKYREQFRTW